MMLFQRSSDLWLFFSVCYLGLNFAKSKLKRAVFNPKIEKIKTPESTIHQFTKQKRVQEQNNINLILKP